MLQKGIALTRPYTTLEPCSRELRLLDRAVNGYDDWGRSANSYSNERSRMSDKSQFIGLDGLSLEGGDMPLTVAYPKSLGTSLYDWNGHDLPRQTGDLPGGFFPPSKTGYKEWIRGRHSSSTWFSYGPYADFGQGQISLLAFLTAPLGRRGAAGEAAFLLELYDFTANRVLASVRPNVSALPSNTPGFTVYTPTPFGVTAGHKYEVRVMALGGCDLEFHLLRIFADVL
jgi:hypothetical protein